MSKPFETAFKEWKDDNSYAILEDCGWEYDDVFYPVPKQEEAKNKKRE